MFDLLSSIKNRLLSTIEKAPIAGSLPLYINGVKAGVMHPNAIQATKHYPSIQHFSDHVEINLSSLGFEERSTFFQKLALHFKENHCLLYWREEQVNVWVGDHVFAHIERTATRPLGLRTQAIHLNAWTPDGKIYLSRRAPHKHTDPNKWDTLAGGLLNAVDSPETGLVRESFEEAGIPDWALQHRSPIRSITHIHRPLPEGYQDEEILNSDCILSPEVQPQNQDGEVSEIRCFTIQEVLHLMQGGQVSTEAMVVLIDSIEKNIFQQLT